MNLSIVAGLLIPFWGRLQGSLRLFPEKTDWRQYSENIYRIRCRCHGGTSVWSLLIPAMDMCEEMEKLPHFFPQ